MRRATSVGGAVTGFGADVFIVDDPTKPQEAHSEVERANANKWARHTLFTRLNDKAKGAIILVMQRLHEDDMIGHVASLSDLKIVSFAAIAMEDEEYRIPTPFGIRVFRRSEGEALHPDREDLSVLAEIRRALGTLFFSAQFQQMPAPPGGSIVRTEWFLRFDPATVGPFESITQSWDTASKVTEMADYSVCTTWGKRGRQLFLLNVFRRKLSYPDLKRAIISHAQAFGATTVLIEDAASGIALIQDLKNDGFYHAIAVKPLGDKKMRMTGQTGVIEAGMVFVPKEAAWLEEYFDELTMFPSGRYNDQVDSTSQALAHLTNSNGMDGFLQLMKDANERWRNTY